MESLWHVAAEQTPRGDIGKLSNQDIADELFYDGDADALIEALIATGWLDQHPEHRLIIHDWHEYCDDAVDNKIARHATTYANGAMPRMKRLSRQERDHITAQIQKSWHSVGTACHEKPLPDTRDQIPVDKRTSPNGEVCSEPPKAASEPPDPPEASPGTTETPPKVVLEFPVVGKGPKTWTLTEAKLAEYREAFPGVDVLAECRSARQWCVDNATKRKTFAGMPAFLSRWLAKEQNSPKARTRDPPEPRLSSAAEWQAKPYCPG